MAFSEISAPECPSPLQVAPERLDLHTGLEQLRQQCDVKPGQVVHGRLASVQICSLTGEAELVCGWAAPTAAAVQHLHLHSCNFRMENKPE